MTLDRCSIIMKYSSFFRFLVCMLGLAFVLLAIQPPAASNGMFVSIDLLDDVATHLPLEENEDDFSGIQTVEEEQHPAVKSPADAWAMLSVEGPLPVDCHEQQPFALVLESLSKPPDVA